MLRIRIVVGTLISIFLVTVVGAALLIPRTGPTKPQLAAAAQSGPTTVTTTASPPTTTQFTATLVSLGQSLNAALQPTTTTQPAIPKKKAKVQAANVRNEPVVLPPAPSETSRAISEAAAEFGVSELTMFSIAKCESHFLTNADNGGHGGLFQQSKLYWPGRVNDFNQQNEPDVGGNIYSPFDNARVSAWMMAAPGGIESGWAQCI